MIEQLDLILMDLAAWLTPARLLIVVAVMVAAGFIAGVMKGAR